MGIFTKKKAEKVVEYSPVEQGVPQEKPMVPVDKTDTVLANQQVIVENQRVILGQIIATQELLKKLAGQEIVEVPKEEKMTAMKKKVKQ